MLAEGRDDDINGQHTYQCHDDEVFEVCDNVIDLASRELWDEPVKYI